MAKELYDREIDKNITWGGDETTGGLPVKGKRIQDFIKNTFDKKMGVFAYDETNNRYLVFADEEAKTRYFNDTTLTSLILGTFDAPFNYSAEINLISNSYVAILTGETGNELNFTFSVKNKQGAETGDNVICTYTFIRGNTKQQIIERYRTGTTVTKNIDEYLSDGTNTIIIGIVGENTLAATTVSVTYQVINLSLSADLDISKVYDLSDNKEAICEIPFILKGYGTKVVEWYLDGVLLEKEPSVDEVTQIEGTPTKYITLANIQHGIHTLQVRAYTIINGEKFYSKTLYYELMINTGAEGIDTNTPFVVTKFELPVGILNTSDSESLNIPCKQYDTINFFIASYNQTGDANTNVQILLDNNLYTTLITENNKEYPVSIILSNIGEIKLKLAISDIIISEKTISVSKGNISLEEITNGLECNLSAVGKSNSSNDKNVWFYKDITSNFSGFEWTENSGWNNNSLIIPEGAELSIDYAPLSTNSVTTGKTIEFELGVKDVINDDVVILDLTESDGTGLKITASEAILKSAGGSSVSTKFSSRETYRISFVINRKTGTTNKGLAFIYVNGRLCGASNYSSIDNFLSNTKIKFAGSTNATIILRSIRSYNIALTSDQILNNYALYNSSIENRINIVRRNDILDNNGNISSDKLMNQLPVMIITGDIPTLEATTDKKTSIVVDVEYINNEDPSRNFTATNMKMTPQGTSSMGYPKKNFKLYSQDRDDTKIYDANGKEIKDRLYSFKNNAIPVNCWCLKADYAESSSTHNTGIARLWNEVMVNAKIDGEYKLRTKAQVCAKTEGYEYDVRTTIDGFPIVLFYRRDKDSDLVFIGKYNFNNDKSTENVFGFKDIPGFDNSKMQCWEVLNNGNHLALFNDIINFDEEWSKAFESRYPDTKTPNISDLKSFCTWASSVTTDNFSTQKWEHLDVYKVAAYYIYLIRFGAVDQVVKNSMLTSEDGIHFFYINYDNDTINGLRNDGYLKYLPTITRQSLDESFSETVYCYAGHESRLWNMLEEDTEFQSIVAIVDNALYEAGLSYKNTIDMFDIKQSSKWCERVYNFDALYKYISPYNESGINNLFMLQGDRSAHRRWWLSKRFAYYDSKWVTGEYKNHNIQLKLASAPRGLTFNITSGYPLLYGYGINNIVQESGIELNENESTTFTTKSVLNIGDPLRIYAAYYIKKIDLSNLAQYLSTIEVGGAYHETLGTKLEELILGNSEVTNTSVSNISGLALTTNLKKLDITGYKGITSIDMTNLVKLEELHAFNSGLTSAIFAKGAKLNTIELPTTIKGIILENIKTITFDRIKFGQSNDWSNINNIKISNCKNLSSDFSKIKSWYETKTTSDNLCSLSIDNINWSCTTNEIISLGALKQNGGILNLKGKVVITNVNEETIEDDLFIIQQIFGENVFNKNSEFYIYIPDSIFLIGESSIVEGGEYKYTSVVFSENKGTIEYDLLDSRTGTSINASTGLLTVLETGNSTSTMRIRARHTATNGTISQIIKTITIQKATYPSSIIINGSSRINMDAPIYTAILNNTTFTGKYKVEWILSNEFNGFLSIKESNNTSCTLQLGENAVTDVINGTISVKIIKLYNNSIACSSSKSISMLNENVIMTSTTNPEVMQIMYNKGLAANSNYMTKQEAANVFAEDIMPGTYYNDSIFYNKNIKVFDEFKYFTSVTSIPAYTFSYCNQLTSITISKFVTSILYNSFFYCKSLNSINVETENNIYDSRNNCNAIIESEANKLIKASNNTIIPNSVTYIGNNAFSYCSLKSITIPNSVTRIGNGAFSNCTSLTSIIIPDSVTIIEENAFSSCSSLTSVEIPHCNIGSEAFSYCEKLTNVSINANITVSDIFYHSYNISNVYIGKDVTEIYPNKISIKALKSIIVDPENKTYDSRNNCNAIIHTASNTIIQGCNNSIIPNSVTSIGSYAFKECISLTSIEIPNSVTSIKRNAFDNCTSLVSITIPNSVTSIEYDCFWNCNALTSIKLPNSITSIRSGLFYNCSSLTSITIPNSVTNIESETFYGCSSLTSITIPDLVTDIGNTAFAGCKKLKDIYAKPLTAPRVFINTFGTDGSYVGSNISSGKTLSIEDEATGYEESYWGSVLLDSTKCNFTLSQNVSLG